MMSVNKAIIGSFLGLMFVFLFGLQIHAQKPRHKAQAKMDYQSSIEILIDMEKFDEAMKMNREGFKKGRIGQENYYVLNGVIYLHAGYIDKCFQELEKCKNINPLYPHLYDILGDAYASIGRLEQALECSDRAIKIEIDFRRYRSRYFINIQAGNLFEALKCAELDYNLLKAEGTFNTYAHFEYLLFLSNPQKIYNFALTDLKKYKYAHHLSGEQAIFCVMSLRALKRDKESDKMLQECLNKCKNAKPGCIAILKYLNGDINLQNTIDDCKKNDKHREPWNQMRAHLWIGIDLYQKGELKDSQKELEWVVDHQVTDCTSIYACAVAKPLLIQLKLKMAQEANKKF